METPKKVFVKTYGCQMNVYDSARMQDALEQDGYQNTTVLEEADLVLLNTCHIREKAAEKVYSEIGRIRQVKEKREATNRPMTIGVTGCVAQAEGAEIVARAPVVDLVAGPQTYHRLPEMVRRATLGERVIDTEFEIEEKFEKLPQATKAQVQSRGVASFLTVQEGCDKFCTFCVVPYTRGAEVSRSSAQILDEAKSLIASGVREITLLGQNVNAWHGMGDKGDEWNFGKLLYAMADVEGLERLRYTTSHPVDMDESLIEAHRDLDCLMPYLHLPVQAGSDRILKAMNRHHTVKDYDAEFEETLQVVREVEYASAFSFKYSTRPGTPGADLKDQIPEEVKSERLQRLQAELSKQQEAFNKQCIGREMDILLEKPGRKPEQLIGRSPWLQSVIVDAKLGTPGDIIKVKVTQAAPNSLNAIAV